jgi:two-component system response regulator HydG
MRSTMSTTARVLIVDDHKEMVDLLRDQLVDEGYQVEVAESGEEALAKARMQPPDAVISDLRMEKLDGFDVLEGIRAIDATIPVFIMTAFGAIESAIEAIKRGAYHYLTKPFQLTEVMLYLERALADRSLREENKALRRVAEERSSLGAMIGRSKPMQALYNLIERVAQSQAPVLIQGESGVGKELVARAVHFQGPRKAKPFIPVNCTALPETLLESELFGHIKGAFTGANTARKGLFLEADGGTLFLDEIGDMPPNLQAKLLRVLEDGEIRPIGADNLRKVDVRVLSATHQDLGKKSREGTFRSDLFYRLNVLRLKIPSLSERPEDIPLLAEHFFKVAKRRNPTARAERLSPESIALLTRVSWPGNVRELENMMERLVIMTTTPTVEASDVELHLHQPLEDDPVATIKKKLIPLRQLEVEYIALIIAQCGGNKTRAAEILGVDVSTIHRRERNSS